MNLISHEYKHHLATTTPDHTARTPPATDTAQLDASPNALRIPCHAPARSTLTLAADSHLSNHKFMAMADIMMTMTVQVQVQGPVPIQKPVWLHFAAVGSSSKTPRIRCLAANSIERTGKGAGALTAQPESDLNSMNSTHRLHTKCLV